MRNYAKMCSGISDPLLQILGRGQRVGVGRSLRYQWKRIGSGDGWGTC